MRATVTADARKLSALTRNPNGAPNAAMSTPAAAGPTVSDAVWTALSVAFADRRCSSGTSVGFSDDIAGWKKAPAPPNTATSAQSRGSGWWSPR